MYFPEYFYSNFPFLAFPTVCPAFDKSSKDPMDNGEGLVIERETVGERLEETIGAHAVLKASLPGCSGFPPVAVIKH